MPVATSHNRSFPLLLVLLMSSTAVLAQSTGTVEGRVLDADGEPLYPATAVLFHTADSTLAEGTTTDAEGRFALQAPPGSYWTRITLIGYTTYEGASFTLEAGDTYTLPTLTLESEAITMDQVDVEAQRDLIEVQPDKTVLNVQGSINSTGSTALELLRKAPGVVVDNNDNIILSGKNGVIIYIDGKPSPLSTADLAAQLRTMQAAEIDAIEIITNPSAKYDAEGNAGIINIRLRRDKSLGANSTVDLAYSYGLRPKYNANTTFNFRTPAQNTFGSYAFSDGEYESWLNLFRIQNNILFDERTERISNGPSNRLRLGTDWFLSKQVTLGLLVNARVNDRNWTNRSLTPITDLNSNETTSVLDAQSNNNGARRSADLNLNLQANHGNGTTTNADVDYGRYNNDNAAYQPNFYLQPQTNTPLDTRIFTSLAPTTIDIYAAKVDHERTLAGGKLGVGTKIAQVTTDNRYSYFSRQDGLAVLDVDRSNDFTYRETIGAGYVTFTRKWGGFNVNMGLRAEATSSQGDLTAFKPADNNSVSRSYFDLFPSGGVTYNPAPQHQMRLNYSRRIDRPSYQALNPFEYKLSELSYARGNPFLRPQYTHSISVAHTYNYVLNTTLTYSKTNDFFANISDSTEVSRTFLETINLDFQRVLSANVSYPVSLKPWWSTYTSVNAFNTRNKADLGQGRVVDIRATSGGFYHQSTFKFPSDWSAELSGWFSSPSIWGAVYKTDANFSIDAGVGKKFLDGRANLKVALTDIFHTAPWRGTQDFAGFFVDASGGWESRQIRFNFSYAFGNNQVKRARQRKTATEAETERIE